MNESIVELLNKWENRINYLQAVIEVEEKFYPEREKGIDALHGRKDELQNCMDELQRIYNMVQIKNQAL